MSKSASVPPVVTSMNIPESYTTRSVVCVPSIGDRLKTIDQHVTSAIACLVMAQNEDARNGMGIVDTEDAITAAVKQIADVKFEVYLMREFLAPEALNLRSPTDEDLYCYGHEIGADVGDEADDLIDESLKTEADAREELKRAKKSVRRED